MTAQKQISTVTQKSQVTTKVVSGLKCPDCREKQVTIKVIRGVIVAGSAKCSACGWSVRVARLNDGVIGKCPCCGSFAFPALGWRSGKQPFVALSCDQCGWVASETYMQAVGIFLARTFTLQPINPATVKATKFAVKATDALMAFPLPLRQLCKLTIVATNLFAHFAVNAIVNLKRKATPSVKSSS